jgi:hypothetical protein
MSRALIAAVLLLVSVGRGDAGLRCVPPSVDLGEIRGGPVRQHRFELVNEGTDAIEILDLPRSCGCLEPRLDRRNLRPGEKASLLVDLRTSGQPNGLRSWNLRVRYRDGSTVREELLILSATIRNEVTVQPAILALEVRDTLRQEIVVTDLRAKKLKVTSVQPSHPSIRPTVQSEAGGITKIMIEVSAASLKPGRHDAMLNIVTDDPLYSPLQLPIALTRAEKSPVSVTPPQVQLRVTADAPVTSGLVRLRASEGQKVVIKTVEVDDPRITATWAPGPGDDATIKVRFNAGVLVIYTGTPVIRVRLEQPAGADLRIPVLVE